MAQRYKTFTADDIIELIRRINDGTEDRFCRDTVWTPGDEIVCRKEIEDCESCLKEWLEEEIESEPTEALLPDSTAWRRNDTPPDEQKVLCWTRTKKGVNNMIVGYYSPQLQRWCLGANSNVIAWTQLPSDELLDEAYRYVMQNSEAGDV